MLLEIILITAALVTILLGFFHLKDRWASDKKRQENNQLFKTTYDEIRSEKDHIEKIANGIYSDADLRENWRSTYPYQDIIKAVKNLREKNKFTFICSKILRIIYRKDNEDIRKN